MGIKLKSNGAVLLCASGAVALTCCDVCPVEGSVISLVFSGITAYAGAPTWDPNISIEITWPGGGGGEVWADATAAEGQGAVIFLSCADGAFDFNYFIGDADYFAFLGIGPVADGTLDNMWDMGPTGGSETGTVTWEITPP